MSKLFLTLLLGAVSVYSAENKAVVKAGEKDMCVAPPRSAAPSLPAHLMAGQGNVHFPITTDNPEAQKFFDQGVAQMHSFWANEAERSFLQAAALDPAAPMPYWGVAMVAAGDYRPRFQLDRDSSKAGSSKPAPKYGSSGGALRAVNAARKALQLSAVPGKATDLEKLYIAAVAARRDPELADRDEGYIRGLRAVTAAYHDEIEAPSYLALHLMRGFTTPDRAPRPGSMEAVEILKALVLKAPDHAGVHHYIIHGWEGSTFAKDAWPSCRRYPELVTNIPHALHMPGHIWAQTGKWEEAAKSFEDAAANELGYIKADALYTRYHHGHNVQFLISTYCFQGNYDKALEMSRHLMTFTENPREAGSVDDPYTAYRQGWYGIVRTLVTFEKWDEILDGKTLPAYDKPRERAWRHWALGLAEANKGSAGKAKQERHAMEADLRELSKATKEATPPVFAVALKELDGQIALAQDKTDKGLKLLQNASVLERAMTYTEPPWYPRPVLDALGPRALAAGKLRVAEQAFRDALTQFPEDPRAVAGLAEALSHKASGSRAASGL